MDMNTNASQQDGTQSPRQDMVPAGHDAVVIEAWFAGAGLAVTVVDHCPINACDMCRQALPTAA